MSSIARRACRLARPEPSGRIQPPASRPWCRHVIALALSGATVPPAIAWATAADPTPAAQLDRTSVPASGKHETLLTVARFGRYAITVKSSQGVSLQLIERMAGPWDVNGTPGTQDGRIDAIADRGQYKLIVRGARRAKGTAELAVHPYEEKNAPPPLLVELKPVTATLADFEQRSYWIEIKERRRVLIEAAGRHLSDLRLWKDGGWLVDTTTNRHVAQPRVGKPLTVVQLNADLAPGFYLLTGYGGPSLPWAEDDGTHPFHLRFGIPRLGDVVRRRFSVSPFGTDRFRVPGNANFFRIELPEARPATLRVADFDEQNAFADAGSVASVEKQSVPPIAELMTEGRSDGDHIVSVSGEQDQPYLLQHFELRQEYPFSGRGDYWLSSVHSGHAADSVDATALVVERSSTFGRPHVEPFAEQVIDVDGTRGWARRANLLGTLTVFLNVKTAGTYQVLADGTETRVRIEPFVTFRPERYRAPDFRGSGSSWDLDAGFHVLTVEPIKKGIVRLAVRPKGLVTAVLDAIGFERAVTERPLQGATRFAPITLNPANSYTVYLNLQPEVRTGLCLRTLPLDLTDPLFVLQRPGETVTVPFRVKEAGALSAIAEDGSALELALDGGTWQKSATAGPGEHSVAVRHSQAGPIAYSLALEPVRLSANAPLPSLPDTALASLPKFPAIAPEAPHFFDLDRQASATFALAAERPGLYRLESTGLLATEGRVRTRTVTSLAAGSENGVGRNFAVQPYLGTGDYQVTVTAREQSTGHLGLTLSRTDPLAGGFITSGVPARISLPSGTAVVYRFNITRPGAFRIHALALGRELRCRLEDAEGWPVLTPGGVADITRELEPGRYRLIVLPETTPTRVVTRIDPAAQVRRYSGHGPHRLPLERPVEHVWLEPEAEQPRTPDAWEFTLPADVEAAVALTADMQATLLRIAEDGGTSPAADIPPARGFRGLLAKGRYRLEAVAARRNNRVPYQLSVSVSALVAGLDRQVTAPALLPVAVGETSLVEIGSYGASDVRARLLDADGRVVAANDDRPDDWNFAIVRTLAPGAYRLEVEPVGAASASCTVSMRTRAEHVQPALALPASQEVRIGRGANLYPLTLPVGSELLIATVRAAESVGVSFETLEGSDWRPLGSAVGRVARLEIPLHPRTPAPAEAPAPAYRLRVWSLDRRDSPVNVSVLALSPDAATEAHAAKGVALPAAANRRQPSALAVTLDRPGLFRVPEDESAPRWCSAPRRPCEAARNGLVAATGRRLWAVGEPGQILRANRVTLSPGAATTVTLDPAVPITADVQSRLGGPVAVLAAARAAQPGARLADRDAPPQLDGASMAAGTRASLTVALRPHRPAVHLWLASHEAEPADAKLAAFDFAASAAQPMAKGVRDGALSAAVAETLTLPAGTKRLRLTLDKGVAAVLSRGDSVEAVFWAEDALSETTETAADRLTLLSLDNDPRRYALELVPLLAAAPTALALGRPFEQTLTAAGVERLAVAPAPGATLHVRGARGEAIFVGAQGLVARGSDIPLDPSGGTLRIEHGVGPVLCWLDRPGSETEDLWARADDAPARAIDLPAFVSLEGPAALLRFKLDQAALLHVRSATPLVTLLRSDNDKPLAEVHPAGTTWDVFRPAGPAQLLVRPFSGSTLAGTLQVTATAVTPIGEGLGPETLLAPGQARLYSFQVTRKGPVGIGVRASSDIVETALMNDRGSPLGRGTLQMPQLEPGTYLLVLTVPPESAPVTARAALAGLAPPDTGPPEDVVRRYLEPEQTQTPFAAPHGAAIDESAQQEESQTSGEGVSENEGTSGEEPPAEDLSETEQPAAETSEGGVE
jgi:hypothetical protein